VKNARLGDAVIDASAPESLRTATEHRR
jgi:hypothetical protein